MASAAAGAGNESPIDLRPYGFNLTLTAELTHSQYVHALREGAQNVRYVVNENVDSCIFKSKEDIMQATSVLNVRISPDAYIELEDEVSLAAEPVAQYMNANQLHKAIESTRKKMLEASKQTDYLTAAKMRDEMISMQKMLKEKFGGK